MKGQWCYSIAMTMAPEKPTHKRRRKSVNQSGAKSAPKTGGPTQQPAPKLHDSLEKPERIAKRMARAGLCSRRDAERWIADGRVKINGKLLTSPAVTVSAADRIEVDGTALPTIDRTRLWLLHKKAGYVTTDRDPEGRPTVFDLLPEDMPRVMTVGRLDMNTEGLLLLTNDGGLARALELPSTGWLRRYRVRAHGTVTQEQLDELRDGVAVDGVLYGTIDAELERIQGANVWLTFAMREGKNREVRNVLASLGLTVNRLIRVSYGPFQLGDLLPGKFGEIRSRTLRDQLGARLIEKAGANFDAPMQNNSAGVSKKRESELAKRAESRSGKKPKGGVKRGRAEPGDPLTRLHTRKPEMRSPDDQQRKKGAKSSRSRHADRRR